LQGGRRALLVRALGLSLQRAPEAVRVECDGVRFP
jgi:hypothetical protein